MTVTFEKTGIELVVIGRDQYLAAITAAQNATHDVGASSSKASTGMGILGNAFDAVGKGAMVFAGLAATAMAGVGAFIASSIGPASDLNETVSKVGVVFADSADQVLKFGETSAASLGMSKNAALSAAGTYGNLFRSMGMTSDKSAEMSINLVQLAGDLASFNNLSPEDVLEKLRAGLTGETEPLKSLGINLSAAAVEARAMEMGLNKGRQELTAAAKAQATYSLILEQTSLAQGDFARTSGGLANQQRIFTASMEDLKAKVGTAFLPAINTAMSALTGILSDQKINTMIQDMANGLAKIAEKVLPVVVDWIAEKLPIAIQFVSDVWTNTLQPAINKVTAAFQKFAPIVQQVIGQVIGFINQNSGGVTAWLGQFQKFAPVVQQIMGLVKNLVGKTIGDITKWFNENQNTIKTYIQTGWVILRSVVSAVITTLKPMITSLWKTVQTTFSQMTPLFESLKNLWTSLQPVFMAVGAILLGAIGVVVGAIGGIVTGLQPFITGVIGVVTGIITALTGVIEFVSGFVELILALFQGNSKAIQEAWQQMGHGITNIVAGLLVTVSSAFNGLVNTVTAVVGGFITTITGFFENLYDSLVGHSIIPDLINGILDWFGKLPDQAVAFINTMVERGKEVLSDAISAFQTLGQNIIDGLLLGINNAKQAVISTLANLALQALDAAKKALGISSPSSVFAETVGVPIVMGIVEGILSKVGDVGKAIASLFTGGAQAGGGAMDAGGAQQMADTFTGSLMPAMQGVGNYLSTVLMPMFTGAGLYWTEVFNPLLLAMTNGYMLFLLPAMQMLYNFMISALHPEFAAFGSYLIDVFHPETTALTEAWQVGLLTALTSNWSMLSTQLNPAVKMLWTLMSKNVIPITEKIITFTFPRFMGSLSNVESQVRSLINAIKRLLYYLDQLSIPAALEQHSPSPFERSLMDVNSQFDTLNKQSVKDFNANLGKLGNRASSINVDSLAAKLSLTTGGSSTVTESRTYNATFNTRMEPSTVRQGFEYFRVMGA